MSETHGRKAKSGIPLLKKSHANLLEPTLTSNPVPSTGSTASATGNSLNSHRDLNTKAESAEQVSESELAKPQVQQAKLKTQIEKKANTRILMTKTNKNTKSSNSLNSNEIWQDERIETVSHSLQAITNTEYERRRQEMALNIKLLEDELAKMNGLLEKRKKVMDEAKEEARQQQESMEKTMYASGLLAEILVKSLGNTKLDSLSGKKEFSILGQKVWSINTNKDLKIVDQQSLLIKHGVDPVTGEQVVLPGGNCENKFTKKKVQEIREKLRDMNDITRVYLQEIEQTLSDIDSLEKASERARPTSPETLKMLQELADSDEFRLMENSQVNSQIPEGNFDAGSLEDFTKEKFGPQVFLTDNDRDTDKDNDSENDVVSSDIEIV